MYPKEYWACILRMFCFSVNNPEHHCTCSICALWIGKDYCNAVAVCPRKFWVLMDQQDGIYVFGLDVILWENQWLCSQRNFGCFLWTFDKHLIGKTFVWSLCYRVLLFYFQYEFHRGAFDEKMNSVEKSKVIPAAPDVKILLQRLLFFYCHSKDSQRLVRVYHYLLCQAMFFITN